VGLRAELYTSLNRLLQGPCGRHSGWASDKAAGGQRGGPAVADNQVVQQPNIDQFEGSFEPLGNAFIGLAGLCDATRVIVRDNQYNDPIVSSNVPDITIKPIITVLRRPSLFLDIPENSGYSSGYFRGLEQSWL